MIEVVAWLFVAAGLAWFHARAIAKRDGAVLARAAILDVVAGLFVLTARADRSRFEAWAQEDGWVEWATFFAFALAGVLAALRARRTWRAARGASAGLAPRRLEAAGIAGVALFCLFVAGEEISWGQRLLSFQPPEIFLETNYQQELNVHNLLKGKELGALRLDSRHLVALIALGYGALLPLLARLCRQRPLPRALFSAAPPGDFAPFFAAVAAVELAYPAPLTGEAAELFLGLLFLAAPPESLRPVEPAVEPAGAPEIFGPGARPALALVLLAAPLALGAFASFLVARALFGADAELEARARAELDALREDLETPGAVRARLRKKTRVHKRLFTAARSGYVRLGERSRFLEGRRSPAEPRATGARRDRKGYFLDPWNNPYWVYRSKKDGRIVLYSFGPNRRRDTSFRPFRELAGDDLGVRLELAPTPRRGGKGPASEEASSARIAPAPTSDL